MRKSLTMVLGAGASIDSGFPTGLMLRRKILELSPQHLARASDCTTRQAVSFLREFRESQRYSIDAFLARRGEFAQIGKVAITLVILRIEASVIGKLTDDLESGENWYQYLVNELMSTDWEDFNPGWLSVVTFNYDRSLEEFLVRSACATYGRSREEVQERLLRLRIVHVYGSLGTISPGPDHLPFGGQDPDDVDWQAPVDIVAKRISVIPEGRDTDPQLEEAKALIASAEKVAFLGFGFDADNVRRLGTPSVFSRATGCAEVTATCLGMEQAERDRAHRKLFRGLTRLDGSSMLIVPRVQEVFFDAPCLSFLRKTLVLGEA